MKVFLSWSGDRSKMVAEAFDIFLKKVIQAVKPWISTSTSKGARWDSEISNSLREAKAGIICLTNDNLVAPWLLFEAGAIAKTADPNVYTFLLDLEPQDVQPPLGSFQHTQFNKDDIYKLIKTINTAVAANGGNAVEDKALLELYDDTWPKFEEALNKAKECKTEIKTAKRSLEELVPEIQDIVRHIDRKAQDTTPFHLTSSIFPGLGSHNTLSPEQFHLAAKVTGDYLIANSDGTINIRSPSGPSEGLVSYALYNLRSSKQPLSNLQPTDVSGGTAASPIATSILIEPKAAQNANPMSQDDKKK